MWPRNRLQLHSCDPSTLEGHWIRHHPGTREPLWMSMSPAETFEHTVQERTKESKNPTQAAVERLRRTMWLHSIISTSGGRALCQGRTSGPMISRMGKSESQWVNPQPPEPCRTLPKKPTSLPPHQSTESGTSTGGLWRLGEQQPRLRAGCIRRTGLLRTASETPSAGLPGTTGDTSSMQTQGYHQHFTDLIHTCLCWVADSQHTFPRAAQAAFPFCSGWVPQKAGLTQQSWERWPSGKQKRGSPTHDQAPQDGEMTDQPKDFATRAGKTYRAGAAAEGPRKPQGH